MTPDETLREAARLMVEPIQRRSFIDFLDVSELEDLAREIAKEASVRYLRSQPGWEDKECCEYQYCYLPAGHETLGPDERVHVDGVAWLRGIPRYVPRCYESDSSSSRSSSRSSFEESSGRGSPQG